MEYLVMECTAAYAVVLDSDGRFLRVPNMGYEVGQTLKNVVIFPAGDAGSIATSDNGRVTSDAAGGLNGDSEVGVGGAADMAAGDISNSINIGTTADELAEVRKKKKTEGKVKQFVNRRIAGIAAAACFCFVFAGGFNIWASPIGTVRIQINPDVQMSVNRFDRVVNLEGLNPDGEALIDGYKSYGHKAVDVSDDLADRAEEMGFLKEGGRITLTVESSRDKWKNTMEESIITELDLHLNHRFEIVSSGRNVDDDGDGVPDEIVIIPRTAYPGLISDDDDDDDDDDRDNDDDDRDSDDRSDRDDDDNDSDDDDDNDRGSAGSLNDDDDDDKDDDDDSKLNGSISDDDSDEDRSSGGSAEDDDRSFSDNDDDDSNDGSSYGGSSDNDDDDDDSSSSESRGNVVPGGSDGSSSDDYEEDDD